MDTLNASSQSLIDVLEVAGTIAFAVSGAMAATRHQLDWFGVVVLGVIVAVGGGTIRALLLGDPAGWIEEWWPVAVAAASAAAVIPLSRWVGTEFDSWNSVLSADAVGLAVFTVVGADAALEAGAPAGVAVVLGVVSGIAGGILRDVLVGDQPAVFTGQIYALAAAVGGMLYVALLRTEVDPTLALWAPIAVIFGLRMVALRRDWSVPKVS
ncbi:MAG: TRIC cation channel family protein [Solirubrobacteraceae bacterium]|nr:TRIC cation channel family protein [Solirubrobacteraceae bacterium]